MTSLANRPAPVCRRTSSSGTADPVRMNCPGGTAVHLAADMVPDPGGFELPLVDELGRVSAEHEARIDADGVKGGIVGVEVDVAGGELLGREGLATRLRALQEHRSGGRQPPLKDVIQDSRAVRSCVSVMRAHLHRLHFGRIGDCTLGVNETTVCASTARPSASGHASSRGLAPTCGSSSHQPALW